MIIFYVLVFSFIIYFLQRKRSQKKDAHEIFKINQQGKLNAILKKAREDEKAKEEEKNNNI